MYDTHTAEIIGAFCYHTPVFVFALASGAVPLRLIDGDTIHGKKKKPLWAAGDGRGEFSGEIISVRSV